MKKLYEKSELAFALVWIGIYCVGMSVFDEISRGIGIESSATAVFIVNITTGDQRHLSAHEKAGCIASAVRLFEVICPDGNYGCHHGYIASLEMLHSLYLWLDGQKDAAFATLDRARENGLKCIKIGEEGVAHYTAPLVRLAEEKPGYSADEARQDYRSMAEDWPWWTVPEVEQVKVEIQADPRWRAWVASTQL